MVTLDMVCKDTIDIDPAEYLRMVKECPDEIESVKILYPVLGKSKDFGKMRVKLARSRYEVKL